MRNLIRNILNESKLALELLDTIKNENIFAAIDLVGGVNNLKKILKEFPDVVDLLDSFYGKMNLLYPYGKKIIEFPMRFEIVDIQKNKHNTNSWPIINLIYDDSKLSKSEKELFEQFVYHVIGDLNIGDIDIKPKARALFKDGNYVAIDFVNGRDWETLDHDIEYNYDDIKNLHREYYIKSYMNESKILQENEEDPTQKILSFLRRRYRVEERNLGDEQHPIVFKTISFDVNGETYTISTFQNKREQIRVITDMLDLHNVIEPIDPYERQLDPYTQKVIRAVKLFLNQVM